MTAKDVVDAWALVPVGTRRHLFLTVCQPRGDCRREPLASDAGYWTWCQDCWMLYDDYGREIIETVVKSIPKAVLSPPSMILSTLASG